MDNKYDKMSIPLMDTPKTIVIDKITYLHYRYRKLVNSSIRKRYITTEVNQMKLSDNLNQSEGLMVLRGNVKILDDKGNVELDQDNAITDYFRQILMAKLFNDITSSFSDLEGVTGEHRVIPFKPKRLTGLSRILNSGQVLLQTSEGQRHLKQTIS